VSTARDHAPTCDFCGLPVAAFRRTGRDEGPSEPLYCCSGCRWAASILTAEPTESYTQRILLRLGLAVFCAMNVMVFSMALWSRDIYADQLQDAGPLADALYDVFRYLAMFFSLPVLWLLGGPILAGVWHSVRRMVVTTDLLVLLGVTAAYTYSIVSVLRDTGHVYFDVGSVVLVFVTLGRWLEANGKLKTGQTLDVLAKLLPETARRVSPNGVETTDVPRDDVRVGDTLRVLAGERFAVDGQIIAGSAVVDQQVVTGESRGIEKQPGDDVYSGTLNVDGDLRIRVTAAAGDETVSRMLALVRHARRAKGDYQRLADRVAAWFVPAVFIIATAAAIWHGVSDGLEAGIFAGLAVVLIACPCALGLATPMAIWTAMGRAARGNVLFRSGRALEQLAHVSEVYFDKTGTLTQADVSVESLVVDESTDRQELLHRTAALAAGSAHALSRAVTRYAASRTVGDDLPKDPTSLQSSVFPGAVRTIPGKGIAAHGMADGEGAVYLGSRRLMDEAGLTLGDSLLHAVEAADNQQAPVALVGWDGRVRGVFTFRETIRPTAAAALVECRKLELQVAVLTGDRTQPAERLHRELNVTVFAEQLPTDKVAAIEQQRREGLRVAMVGDGINDAPALAAADVGVALDCGADLSRDSADVCLLSSDLQRLPWTVSLAKRTVRTIHQNLFWAFAYNGAGIVLAATGRLNPVWAGAAMVASSIIVVTNSLRLNRFPEPISKTEQPDTSPSPAIDQLGDEPYSPIHMPGTQSVKPPAEPQWT